MVQPIEGLSAVTVHVRDIQVARKFYREVLGLNEANFVEAAGRAVFSFPGNPTILTMHVQRPGEGGREPGTVSGIIFHHHDPRAAVEEIRRTRRDDHDGAVGSSRRRRLHRSRGDRRP